jgi:hypothetical protein
MTNVRPVAREAEHHPDYREDIRLLSKDFAEAYIRAQPAEGIV